MIFLDESGDDGMSSVSSQKFFVVSLIFTDSNKAKIEYFKLSKIFKSNSFKWNSLRKASKVKFKNYAKDIDYKVICEFITKNKFTNLEGTYLDLCKDIFGNLNIENKKEKVAYTGDHLGKMFAKLKKHLKNKNKKLTFSQAIGDELYGVTMADLWAGYINYSLKNKENLQQSKYILVKEYGNNQDEQ